MNRCTRLSAVSLLTLVFALFSLPSSAQSGSKQIGIIKEADGFTYFIKSDGSKLLNDYAKIDEQTIYYFGSTGHGVRQQFKVLNKQMVQIWNNGGTTSAFLIIGDKKALFVDGLFGYGNFKKLATFFTDKPVSIAFTHASVDHSGAGYRYDAFPEIYIHPLEAERFHLFGKSPWRRYTNDTNEIRQVSKVDLYDTVSIADYSQYDVRTRVLPMNDGTLFDLGGLHVESIQAPGHQPGCSSFLLKEPKILIGGDCAGGGINDYTVEDYWGTMNKFIARESEWTTLYASHGTGGNSELPLSWYRGMREICEGVLTGRIKGEPANQGAEYKVYGGKGVRWSTRSVKPSTWKEGDKIYPSLNYDPELILNFQK